MNLNQSKGEESSISILDELLQDLTMDNIEELKRIFSIIDQGKTGRIEFA